ncbi:MAG: alpha-N-acetylglucosaminidase C-terminal domain-containing protein, partial [Sedimentisphaerales bacterium]|nr:alpha-N-acetylglucosaminidase C-terminal domain-containing protein [Sedimentisphaerales bacterium]
DELLATRREFLLGRWLEDAKRWGMNEVERARFEWNARRVLTLWGQGPAIDDYARKEWSGMLNGYYRLRWQQYLSELETTLSKNMPFDEDTFQAKLRPWMSDWSDQQENYPTLTRGDSVQIAQKLWTRYGRQLDSKRN